MRTAYTVWTWGLSEKRDFEQALKEVSDLGYAAVENFNRLVPLYEDAIEDFRALLTRYRVEFAALYHYLTPDFAADRAMAERCFRFLDKVGARTLNIQATRRDDQPVTPMLLDEIAARLETIGAMGRREGIDVCLHPHFGMTVERADELDHIAAKTSPDNLALCLDTAHLVLGGMDPLAVFTRYADRIKYVHFKDVLGTRPAELPWNETFRELGEGMIDFRPVFDLLKRRGYAGTICVELDRPRVCNYKSASISRTYLRDKLGI